MVLILCRNFMGLGGFKATDDPMTIPELNNSYDFFFLSIYFFNMPKINKCVYNHIYMEIELSCL